MSAIGMWALKMILLGWTRDMCNFSWVIKEEEKTCRLKFDLRHIHHRSTSTQDNLQRKWVIGNNSFVDRLNSLTYFIKVILFFFWIYSNNKIPFTNNSILFYIKYFKAIIHNFYTLHASTISYKLEWSDLLIYILI